MGAKREVSAGAYFATHPVFSLEQAADALAPPGGEVGTAERLKYDVEKGRLFRAGV